MTTSAQASFPNFSSGELSPNMYGRFDVAAYFSGVKRLENFIPQVTGPAHFRTGLMYAAETAGNNKAFLWTWKFSAALSFVLEFTDQKLRFFRNNGIVSGADLTTPFLEDELFELKFAQKGVDIYIVHPNHNPQKLTYTSPTNWSLTPHNPAGLTLSANNYPKSVAFYEQRLVYGGTNNNPQTLFFSKSADEDDFTVGTEADDGIEYTIAGDGSEIQWLAGTDKFLGVGAFSDVLKVTGGIDDVITPSSISIRPSNSFGAADINSVGRNNELFFVQRNQLTLRSFEYDFQNDGYLAIDRNAIAEHITKSGITQITFQEGRPNVLWCSKTNGELIGMTVENQEQISGWHRHNTVGEIVSVTSTPREKKFDQLWACVKRTINGVDKYYVEYLSDEIDYPRRNNTITGNKNDDDLTWGNLIFESGKGYVYVDSALTYDGSRQGINANANVTPGATTGTSVTFTASSAVFSSGDVGREIWRKSVTGAETGRAKITTFNSLTSVECEILENFDSTDVIPPGEWYLTASIFTNISHLEGETVSIAVDGGQHPQRTVNSGSVSLDGQASVVHVGLPYTGYIETNNLEVGGIAGPAQTKKKVLKRVGIRFLDTLYAKYGSSYYNLNIIEQRTAAMKMDRPPLLFSGDVLENYANQPVDDLNAGWTREKNIVISQDQPFPCKVQLLVPYTETAN